jgi:hypothetical protein
VSARCRFCRAGAYEPTAHEGVHRPSLTLPTTKLLALLLYRHWCVCYGTSVLNKIHQQVTPSVILWQRTLYSSRAPFQDSTSAESSHISSSFRFMSCPAMFCMDNKSSGEENVSQAPAALQDSTYLLPGRNEASGGLLAGRSLQAAGCPHYLQPRGVAAPNFLVGSFYTALSLTGRNLFFFPWAKFPPVVGRSFLLLEDIHWHNTKWLPN